MESRYNRRSPAVRRLMREAIELRDPTSLYHAQPLEENLFEWHFTIRGPPGTDYEGGRYHGRILLPPEYPMKPPSIVILTPNGRFELNQKICLSASSYHPELWQASWGIRTMLLALIGFMPTDGFGTIGSLECTSEVRRNLAQRSLDWVCPSCGIANRTALPEGIEGEEDKEKTVAKEVEEIVSQMAIKSEQEIDAQYKQQVQTEKSSQSSPVSISPDQSHDMISSDEAALPDTSESTELRQRRPEMSATVPGTVASSQASSVESGTSSNSFILLLIVMLIIAIVVLLMRRLVFM